MCALSRSWRWGGGCFFATLYISPLWSVLSRFNCVVDNYTTHHLKCLYGRLFACCLMVWCIPCTGPGDRTSVVVTTVVVTPTQSCVRLPGLLSSASFDGGNRSDNGLVRVWPAENSPIVQLCLPLTRRQAPPLLDSTLNKQLAIM